MRKMVYFFKICPDFFGTKKPLRASIKNTLIFTTWLRSFCLRLCFSHLLVGHPVDDLETKSESDNFDVVHDGGNVSG